jgi:hypothetical protein
MFGYPVCPIPFVEEAIYSPTYIFGASVKNQMAVTV